MFSTNNNPFCFGPISGLALVPRVQPPTTLVRSTNDNYHYFGFYPHFCALIATGSMITNMIGKSGLHTKRHVVRVPVVAQIGKEDVMRKINQLISQLEAFAGICEWKKKKNIITVTFMAQGRPTGERMDFECYVCDDDGCFHIMVSKECLWRNQGPEYPRMDSDEMNKLIFSIRRIYQDKDNLTALPELDEDSWEELYPLTREHSTENVHFPQPEWMNDDGASWNFPETEPFEPVPPLDIGDILENLSFRQSVLADVSCMNGVENLKGKFSFAESPQVLESVCFENLKGFDDLDDLEEGEIKEMKSETVSRKRRADESEDAPASKKARIEQRSTKRRADESEDAPASKKARIEPQPQEQDVFEVEECEEPPYKKRRLNKN